MKPTPATFEQVLERTNCKHQTYQPGEDEAVLEEIIDQALAFPHEALQARFGRSSTPNREIIGGALRRAEYISAIRSKNHDQIVGIGEIYRMAEQEHEISFMWREDFTGPKAGLAHFMRRGLICHNLRHLFSVAANNLQAKTIVAYVSAYNDRAINLLEGNGFYQSQQDGDDLVFRKPLDAMGATSKLHEFFCMELFGDE